MFQRSTDGVCVGSEDRSWKRFLLVAEGSHPLKHSKDSLHGRRPQQTANKFPSAVHNDNGKLQLNEARENWPRMEFDVQSEAAKSPSRTMRIPPMSVKKQIGASAEYLDVTVKRILREGSL